MTGIAKDQIARCLGELEPVLPGRISTSAGVCAHHANTLTRIPAEPPDAVVWPETVEEVQRIVASASLHRVPLVAFGAGTSLEGHVNAPLGGIAIDFSRMNRILAVRPDDLDCTVEAGVTLQQLRKELKPTGLFFPVDPGAETATLGGMAATRASGTTTVRYGSMRDNVVSVTAVLASGDIVTTARRALKTASGYDLTHLLIGSEGTLGLITSLTLRLYGVPESMAAAVAAFPSVGEACGVVTDALHSGLGMARIELLDSVQIRCINAYAKLALEEAPTLFVEFHGSHAGCLDDLETFKALAEGHGVRTFEAASDEDGRRKLWSARHNAFWAAKMAWRGKQMLVTDVAVPLSKLAGVVVETADDIARSGLHAPLVGHVGDGNFHAIVALDPDNLEEVGRVEAFCNRLVERALSCGGTATGEHGIGQGKARFMMDEHGAGVAAMRAIKTALDPLGILNPGKIFAPSAGAPANR